MTYRAGRRTLERLVDWDRGQADAERLAGQLLRLDGFRPEPIHPKGGRDGGRDLIFSRENKLWIAACYFPGAQQRISKIRRKFASDCGNAKRRGASGFAFLTNQDLKRSEVEELQRTAGIATEIYPVERVRQLLDDPRGYGVRLEFLEVDMSPAEQVAFFAAIQREPADIASALFSDLRPRIQHATIILTKDDATCTISQVDVSATVLLWSPNDPVSVELVNKTTLCVRRRRSGAHLDSGFIEVQVQVVEYGPRQAL